MQNSALNKNTRDSTIKVVYVDPKCLRFNSNIKLLRSLRIVNQKFNTGLVKPIKQEEKGCVAVSKSSCGSSRKHH